jgi:hypothetical protein
MCGTCIIRYSSAVQCGETKLIFGFDVCICGKKQYDDRKISLLAGLMDCSSAPLVASLDIGAMGK